MVARAGNRAVVRLLQRDPKDPKPPTVARPPDASVRELKLYQVQEPHLKDEDPDPELAKRAREWRLKKTNLSDASFRQNVAVVKYKRSGRIYYKVQVNDPAKLHSETLAIKAIAKTDPTWKKTEILAVYTERHPCSGCGPDLEVVRRSIKAQRAKRGQSYVDFRVYYSVPKWEPGATRAADLREKYLGKLNPPVKPPAPPTPPAKPKYDPKTAVRVRKKKNPPTGGGGSTPPATGTTTPPTSPPTTPTNQTSSTRPPTTPSTKPPTRQTTTPRTPPGSAGIDMTTEERDAMAQPSSLLGEQAGFSLTGWLLDKLIFSGLHEKLRKRQLERLNQEIDQQLKAQRYKTLQLQMNGEHAYAQVTVETYSNSVAGSVTSLKSLVVSDAYRQGINRKRDPIGGTKTEVETYSWAISLDPDVLKSAWNLLSNRVAALDTQLTQGGSPQLRAQREELVKCRHVVAMKGAQVSAFSMLPWWCSDHLPRGKPPPGPS